MSSHFRVEWHQAMSLCSAFGMELVSIDSRNEFDHFENLCRTNEHLFGNFFHIGGLVKVAKSTTEWYWTNSGQKINFDLTFAPGEPNNAGGNQMCMCLTKHLPHFLFDDIQCLGANPERFVCQKLIQVQHGC